MMRIHAAALLSAGRAAAAPFHYPNHPPVKSPAELILAPKNMLAFEGKPFLATPDA
jgi:hypothetical protein